MRPPVLKERGAFEGAKGGGAWAGRFAAVVLLLLASAVVFICAANIAAPYPIEPSDGGMLSSAWRVREGTRIYSYLDEPPFVFNIHPPVMIYLSALAFRIAGPALWGPRLISIAFFAGAAYLVFAIVRRATGSRTAGLIAGLFILVERHFSCRAALAVCDFPAIFFSLLGLYLWISSGGRKWLAPAVFTLAFFSKQSAVLAPAAVLLSLVAGRDWRQAGRFALAYALAMTAGLLAARVLFGSAFFANTFLYGTTGAFPAAPGLRNLMTLLCYPAPLAAVLFLAVRGKGRLERLVVPFYVAAGVLLAFASGRSGGSRAYFFDAAAGMALALGLAWPGIEAFFGRAGRSVLLPAATAALFLQAGLFTAGAIYGVDFSYALTRLSRQWKEGKSAARRPLFEREGMVLSRCTGYDVGTPGRNFTTDPHRLGQLLQAGVVARAPIAAAARGRAFSAAIIPSGEDSCGIFDEELKEAVRRNYQLLLTRAGEEYYVPR